MQSTIHELLFDITTKLIVLEIFNRIAKISFSKKNWVIFTNLPYLIGIV